MVDVSPCWVVGAPPVAASLCAVLLEGAKTDPSFANRRPVKLVKLLGAVTLASHDHKDKQVKADMTCLLLQLALRLGGLAESILEA
eukprot:3394876-Pyramimonas_sp.AAC.1